MKLIEVGEPFDRKGWSFELKLDGFRSLAFVEGDARLLSRSGNDAHKQFPSIVGSLRALDLEQAIFDGELVCFDAEGLPDFNAMQRRFKNESPTAIATMDRTIPATYCIFDLLFLNGRDLRQTPLRERRLLLEELGMAGDGLRVVDVFPEHGKDLFEHVAKLGFEGIVGKRLDSIYQPGVRSSDWVKVKQLHTEEFVVGGYTEGEGARRAYFGSLLLGKPEGDTLRYVGTSGGGFKEKQLKEITSLLRPLESKKNPFTGPITASGVKHFVEPRLWAEVSFQAYTPNGRIRIPVFQRMRPDLEGVHAKDESSGNSQRAADSGEPAARSSLQVAGGPQEGAASGLEGLQTKLMSVERDGYLEVEGARFHLSNLDRVMWPAFEDHPALTKRDVLIFLGKIAPFLLPHLKDRPLTFMRFGKGITGKKEVERHWAAGLPDFVDRAQIFSVAREQATEHMLVNNLATLLWTGQIDILEWHPWYSRVTPGPGLGTDWGTSEETVLASALNYPDFIVFDLDPYLYSGNEAKGEEPELNPSALEATVEVAKSLREMLEQFGLPTYLKWSGKTGFHVYVPIQRSVSYEVTRPFAEQIGGSLLKQHPDLLTLEWSVEKRAGKVFFDFRMNVRAKTLVAPFSPRGVPGARLAWPLTWTELDSFDPHRYSIYRVDDLLDGFVDPWSDILDRAVDLQKLIT